MRHLAALFLLPLALSACVPALILGGAETGVTLAENRPVGQKVNDVELYTNITNAFFEADQERLITDVTFNVRYGRVMLTGTVKNERDAQKAAQITWKAKGVSEVINELIVTTEGGFFDTANDSLIKRNLEARILATKDVWLINYSIDIQRGTAYFIGSVKDRAELDRVMNVARTTKGVKKIVSHLQVNPKLTTSTKSTSGSPVAAVESAPASDYVPSRGPINAPPIPQDSTRVAAPDSISSTPLAAPTR